MNVAKLGDIARVFNGNSISVAEKNKSYRSVDGIPYIGTAEVGFDTEIDYHSGVAVPISKLGAFRLAKAGTPLVCAEGGSAGRKVGFLDRAACFGNKLFAIEPKGKWDGRFLFYFCRSEEFRDQFRSLTTGLIGGVSIKKFKEIEVPAFPLEDQRRIVAVLDEAFAAIATATANAQKNFANAQELLSQSLSSIFEGGISRIGDHLELQRGFDITKRDQRTGQVPVVSSSGIKSHHAIAMAKGPGVVIGRKGTLGSAFYVQEDYWPHDTTLWVKDFKSNNPKLVYYLFRFLDVKKLDSGTANPSLNRNLVHDLTVKWPLQSKQTETVHKLDQLNAAQETLRRSYETKVHLLTALKQSLLHRAFTGELTATARETIAA